MLIWAKVVQDESSLPYAKVVQGCGKAKRKAENFTVERKHTDKLQFIAQKLYTFSKPLIYLSCFIFMFQLIDYQRIQEMKHTD